MCFHIYPYICRMETETAWKESRGRKRIYDFTGFEVGDIWRWTARGKNVAKGKAKPSYAHKIYLSAKLWSKTRNLGWVVERRVDGLVVMIKRTA